MTRSNHKEVFKRILVDFIQEEDPVLAMLKWITSRMMEIEAEAKVGAEKGKHSEERKTHFSGSRVRRFDTRMGTIYLLVPKLRKGGYIPFFISERKRSEQALMSLVQEAFVNGVSTRKIDRLAKSLGIENISAGQVSEINKGLNEQVNEFRNRPLEAEYPFTWVDAMYEKVRFDNKTVSTAIMIAYAVNNQGQREILAIEPMLSEAEDCWREFFRKLKKRGVRNICLCISDAHSGIQAALRKEFTGSSWQRCKVHFMRNILAHVPHKEKARFAEKLKQIWLQPTREDAEEYAKSFISQYEKRFSDAIECLESGLEDSLQFYDFPEVDKRKISSTNILERLNRENRRRTRVVGVFPSRESYIRLVTSYLIEYSEDWQTERSYIKQEGIVLILQRREDFVKKAA
jgi:transposase-like protein